MCARYPDGAPLEKRQVAHKGDHNLSRTKPGAKLHDTAHATSCKSKAVQPVSARTIKSSGRCPKPILTRPPCVPLLPKDNFLFGIIEKNPVFMRLFSIFPACFLFGIIGDNITARQFIITINSGKIYFFSVKRKNNRILLCIILLRYNNIANNPK